jgi:hypothetical protein
MHILCLQMGPREFLTEPPPGQLKHLACVMYPLSISISFEGITNNVTRVSRVKLPLSKFHTIRSDEEDDVQFLAMVELEAESVVGGYSRPEHDACVASLPNGGLLNRVFKLAGVAYGPRPEPSTEAHAEGLKKRKIDAYSKPSNKRAKVPVKKNPDH